MNEHSRKSRQQTKPARAVTAEHHAEKVQQEGAVAKLQGIVPS
jgi:hypothetical protein